MGKTKDLVVSEESENKLRLTEVISARWFCMCPGDMIHGQVCSFISTSCSPLDLWELLKTFSLLWLGGWSPTLDSSTFPRSEDAKCGHDAYTLHSTETNPRSGILQIIQDTLKARGWQAVTTGSTHWEGPVRRTKCLLSYALNMKSQDRLKIDIDPVLLVFGNPKRKRPLFLIEIQCG